MLRRVILLLYALLFTLLTGSVLAVQIVGIAGIYRSPLILPFSFAMMVLIGFGFWRFYPEWAAVFAPQRTVPRWLQASLLISAIALIVIVFVFRLGMWPLSVAGAQVPDDFFSYHGVKIMTLLQSGSVWNLEIPYGQYPFGYEGFAAFLIALTGSLQAIGASHVVIVLLVWLTFALLLVRWRSLPFSFALMLAALLAFVPVIYSQMMTVGKNDLLLSLSLLMALLFAPAGKGRWHPVGLAAATMLSLATKATGLYLLFYLWLLVLWDWGQAFRKGKAQEFLSIPVFALLIVLMFPGGLWVIRNIVVMGEPFTAEVASFFGTSIAANLTNPALWTSGGESLWFIAALVGLVLLLPLTWRDQHLGIRVAGVLLVIAITFAVAPLSAFHPTQPERLHIEWRYGLHGIMLALLIVMILLWPLAQLVYDRLMAFRVGQGALIAAPPILAVVMMAVLAQGGSFAIEPDRQAWLTDPYGAQPSIYDAAAELPPATIYIGRDVSWFHLMTANPDLTVTQGTRYPLGRPDLASLPVPDYAIVGAGYQPPFNDYPQPYQWQAIYSDETGTLYRRIP